MKWESDFLSFSFPSRPSIQVGLRGVVLIVIGMSIGVASAIPQENSDSEFFESKIRPILVEHCYPCHSSQADELQGGLRLDTREGSRLGGDTGPAVVPKEPSQSMLLAAIRHDGLKMPPERKLSSDIVANFEMWIRRGAFDPREGSEESKPTHGDHSSGREHWAWKAIEAREIPNPRKSLWSSTAVDPFILEKLDEAGLEPSPEAEKWELCRRIHFDLLGLPPSIEAMEEFLADTEPDAFLRLVDRLLANPRYGERWGQHWLDVVRYAETEGFEYDRTIVGAWRFRDYVIRSLNQGKPMDRFIFEQLAGDEIAETASVSEQEKQELRIAAGFHRLGAVRRNAGNQEVAGSRNEVLTERTDIVGSALLGVTIGCARCHNHKFDPFSQKDYYRLQSYFASSHERDLPVVSEEERILWERETQKVQSQIDELKKQLADQSTEDQKETRRKLDLLEKELPPPLPSISSIRNDFEKETAIHVLRRGEWSLPGERVTAGPPTLLNYLEKGESHHDSPRTDLAGWILHPSNPLTPRVFVNRVWLHHFGQGIVPTANDFGRNGQKPTHPELLDYLADTFLNHNWELKPLHREILLSSTYRQSSDAKSIGRSSAIDPKNGLLGRFPARRLSAEEIRDSMLAIAGTLQFSLGGPSIMLPVDRELTQQLYKVSQWQVTPDTGERNRRSIYLIAKRNLRLPFMEVFDQPALQISCARREQSTHAPQALELLNGDISNQTAIAWAESLQQESRGNRRAIIDQAFRESAGRCPTELERGIAERFLEENSIAEFALAMFNLNAFLYVR